MAAQAHNSRMGVRSGMRAEDESREWKETKRTHNHFADLVLYLTSKN